MKILCKFLLAVCLLMTAATSNAWAYHGHGHVSVMVGPVWGPWYYPPPMYYPPVVIERPQPQVYIEQSAPAVLAAPPAPAAAPVNAPTNYWYYCASKRGYYPYVKDCPETWMKVVPQMPGQP